MKLLDLLIEARNLIANVGWCQGAHARDKAGRDVPVEDAAAVAFCSVGALIAVTLSQRGDPPWALTLAAREILGNKLTGGFAAFNDASDTTQEKVLAVYDKAIGELS